MAILRAQPAMAMHNFSLLKLTFSAQDGKNCRSLMGFEQKTKRTTFFSMCAHPDFFNIFFHPSLAGIGYTLGTC